MLSIGMEPNDSAIKQELFLKHRYVEECNQLLENFEIGAKIIEKDIELQKAA